MLLEEEVLIHLLLSSFSFSHQCRSNLFLISSPVYLADFTQVFLYWFPLYEPFFVCMRAYQVYVQLGQVILFFFAAPRLSFCEVRTFFSRPSFFRFRSFHVCDRDSVITSLSLAFFFTFSS